MAVKGFEELTRDLHNKIYSPIYLFQGEEAYYIDQAVSMIENSVLNDMEKEFNQTVLYGREINALNLISTAKRYPMMSNYQVVIVKEAQESKELFPNKESKDEKQPFLNYILNPLPSTLLVICYKYKTLDKRTKLYKAIEKKGIVFESKKLYDNQIPDWIEKYLKSKKFSIEEKAKYLMADSLGTDLSKIVNECDKLLINLKPGQPVTVAEVEKNIGISKDFNVFELQKAIGKKDVLKANQIINYFKANPKSNPFQVTMAVFYNYFSKLLLFHSLPDKSNNGVMGALKVNYNFIDDYKEAARAYNPVKLAEISGLLREYDLRSKGVNNSSTDQGELLRELVFKIMH